LRGFAPLLAAVAMLSMATATLRLKLEDWLKARSNPAPSPTAIATIPLEPISSAVAATAMPTPLPERPALATVAATEARDLAQPPAAAPTAMPTRHEPPALATVAVTEARDLASPDAAAARAKAVVQRSFGIANAKILEPAIAKRIGDGSSASRAKPRYQTEVVVEIPRGFGPPIQRQYFLTLQYVGGGDWQIEGMTFATRY
jgi:hypothetical protein